MATTIPKQFYVTVQYQKAVNSETNFLGFASPYTKDAAFRKRKDTQEQWAYGSKASFEIQEDDSIVANGNNLLKTTELFISNAYPRIVDNEPVDGFQISRSVRRSGYSGPGNVVWRITDPRGYDLEISSENFAKLVDSCTLLKGVVQEKCCWGRDGSRNILLPATSEPYLDAIKQTARVNSKVSLKDLVPGDVVSVLSTQLKEDAQDNVTFLGRYYALIPTHHQDTTRSVIVYAFSKIIDKYVFKLANGKYIAFPTPKISSITQKTVSPLDKVTVAKELTAYVQDLKNEVGGMEFAALFSPSNIDVKKITCELIDTNVVAPVGSVPYSYGASDLWGEGGTQYSLPIYICEHAGQCWLGGVNTDYSGGQSTESGSLTKIDIDKLISGNTFDVLMLTEQSRYGRDARFVARKLKILAGDIVKVKKIKIKYGGDETIINGSKNMY